MVAKFEWKENISDWFCSLQGCIPEISRLEKEYLLDAEF